MKSFIDFDRNLNITEDDESFDSGLQNWSRMLWSCTAGLVANTHCTFKSLSPHWSTLKPGQISIDKEIKIQVVFIAVSKV